jgi:hypothetical protein
MIYLVYLVIYGGFAFVVLIVASLIWTFISSIRQRSKLDAARREYQELYIEHGYSAKDHCPHRVVEIGQIEAGVITMATKWCACCRKNLGPATLSKSFILGNRWK